MYCVLPVVSSEAGCAPGTMPTCFVVCSPSPPPCRCCCAWHVRCSGCGRGGRRRSGLSRSGSVTAVDSTYMTCISYGPSTPTALSSCFWHCRQRYGRSYLLERNDVTGCGAASAVAVATIFAPPPTDVPSVAPRSSGPAPPTHRDFEKGRPPGPVRAIKHLDTIVCSHSSGYVTLTAAVWGILAVKLR